MAIETSLLPNECWYIIFGKSDLGDVVRMRELSRRFKEIISTYLSTAGAKRALLLRVWNKLAPSLLHMPPSFYNVFDLQRGDGRGAQLKEIDRFIAAQKDRLGDLTAAAISQLALATLPSGNWFHDEIKQRLGDYGFSADNRVIKELAACFKNWDSQAPYVSFRLQYEGLRDCDTPFKSLSFKVKESTKDTDLTAVRLLVTITNRVKRGLPVDDYLKLLESEAISKIKKKEVLFQVHFFIHLAKLYLMLNKVEEAKEIVLATIETARGIHCREQKGYAWALLGSLLKDEKIVARLVVSLQELIEQADDKQIYLCWMVHVLLHQGEENRAEFAQYLSEFETSLRNENGLNTINMLLRAANIHLLGKSFCNHDRSIGYLIRALQLAKSRNKLEEKLLILSDWAAVITIRFALDHVKDPSLRSKVLLEMAKRERLDEAAELIRHFEMHRDSVFLSEFRRYAPDQASKLVLSFHKHPKRAAKALYKVDVSLRSIMRNIAVMQSLNLWEHEAQARLLLRKMTPIAAIVRWQAALGDIGGVMATLAELPEDNNLKIIAIDELARRLIA